MDPRTLPIALAYRVSKLKYGTSTTRRISTCRQLVLLTLTVLMLAALVSGHNDADNSSSFWDNWSDNS